MRSPEDDGTESGMKDLPWVERETIGCRGESGPLLGSATSGARVFSAVHSELDLDMLSACAQPSRYGCRS